MIPTPFSVFVQNVTKMICFHFTMISHLSKPNVEVNWNRLRFYHVSDKTYISSIGYLYEGIWK